MNKRSAVTIHDVATLAGLPIRTASAVLYSQRVTPADHRQRIQTAAAKLAYTAFPPEHQHPGCAVAIAVPTATAWFYAEAVETAREILADRGIDSTVISFPGDPARQNESPAGLDALEALAGRINGLLLMGTELHSAQTDAVLESGLAVVGIGPQAVPGDTVRIDDELAAFSATSHLLNLGHWNVGLLAGTDTIMAECRAGFTRALAEHDLEADADLIVSAETSIDGGYMAMNELIANRGRPTAVLAGCDEIAFGALTALREHGLSAPKHVSLIGIDDHPMSAFLELTTVSQPVTDQAALAASLLADRLQNEVKKSASTTYRLPTALVTRKTTRRATTTHWATSRDL
jgi:DNA-binding LacI/PurR family transcriptional regulator